MDLEVNLGVAALLGSVLALVVVLVLAVLAQQFSGHAVVGDALQVEPYAIMLRKDDPGFKALVDGTLARLMGEKLAERWKQPVVIEKKPGANTTLGTDLVAKSAPDGPTLVMGAVATHAINPWLYTKMPYDAQKDLAPIVLLANAPLVMVTGMGTPALSMTGCVVPMMVELSSIVPSGFFRSKRIVRSRVSSIR